MPEFRLRAVSDQGKLILTEFEATSKKEAESRVDRIARVNGFSVKNIEKKESYNYKVKKGLKDPIKGEQEAYSKEELERALVKLGYKVISINKKWFNFKLGVPMKEIVTFNVGLLFSTISILF
jgi:type IV pilus assembly protein PilC